MWSPEDGSPYRSSRNRVRLWWSRRANGLIDEFQLAQLNLDVVLTYAKEAADADHNEINLARLVEQNFADGAKLLVLIVVDVEADEFR